MSADNIKTKIKCENIAPIINLEKEISSKSLKFGIFANNGSGKTFISRLFRLIENKISIVEENFPTDKFITFGAKTGKFNFSIKTQNQTHEEFNLVLNRNTTPNIPESKYIYHTFNKDYVEENVSALDYEKSGEITGYILGKSNIDIKEDEKQVDLIKNKINKLSQKIEESVELFKKTKIDNFKDIKRLKEYKLLTFENIKSITENTVNKKFKTIEELETDYKNTILIPENLDDIDNIEFLDINIDKLMQVIHECNTAYSLSSLSTSFKKKIQAKQSFIESGLYFLNDDKTYCPFCEQHLSEDALKLIDNYTNYLNDTESKKKKLFQYYIAELNSNLSNIKELEVQFLNRKNEFDDYKKKYIPSIGEESLSSINTYKIKKALSEILEKISKKVENIAIPINIEFELIKIIQIQQEKTNKIINQNNLKIDSINIKKNKINEENIFVRREICKSAQNILLLKHKIQLDELKKLKFEKKLLVDKIEKKKEKQKISKRDLVAKTIKQVLNTFFKEKYKLDSTTFRLVFNKNLLEKNQAKYVLSEGEKNIIAFAYYIGDTHLKINNDDDYNKLFFVIDDPISSMDFNHVYTLCNIIREFRTYLNKIQTERFIVFTHNNDFMHVLITNNIITKKLLLKDGELKDFNTNSTVPYIHHLMDIYSIAKKGVSPSHTTANSIRHIIETLTKFEKFDISKPSIDEYIKDKIPNNKKSYTLINDLSHGGWRSEQQPISDDDYKEICEEIINHIETYHSGQIKFCEKTCN